MFFKITNGNVPNVPTAEYYAESDQELEEFTNVTPGSVGFILTIDGLRVKMYHSTEGWIEV